MFPHRPSQASGCRSPPRLAATADTFGYAKDPFALKPLLVTETDSFVAIATEEIAIRAAFTDNGQGGSYKVREAQAKEVRVWQR